MEATGLSLGKSVLDGALGYAKSAVAEEVALQLGVQRDHAFISDELEMMMAFLMVAHDERDQNKVVKTWVKQVRDVAYDVEDSLQDVAVRLGKPSWWRILRTLRDRRRVAMQMKELRAKVEDVSQRNIRYRLIKGSDTKPPNGSGQSSMISATMSGTEEAMRQRNKAKAELSRLIIKKDEDLRVIALWGTNDVLGEMSILKRVYDDLKRDNNKFECHAWIRITHPFNPVESLQNIVRQFFVGSLQETTKTHDKSTHGAQDLRRMGKMKGGNLIKAFKKFLDEKSYLIILCDLSTTEEWDKIKTCFPNNKKGSRLIVCTEQVEVASLCVAPETEKPEHKQLSANETLYAFYEKGSLEGTCSTEPGPSSNVDIADDSMEEKRLTRVNTVVSALKESQLIGRVNEISEIINLVLNNESQQFEVIAICGMGGLGKTTLVKYVYQSQEISSMFDKRACVTIKRPFDRNELHRSLVMQLGQPSDQQKELPSILERNKYLIVLDDVSSTKEWDAIKEYFPTTVTGSRIIVTTRVENIAKYCSNNDKNIHRLKVMGDKDTHNLFTEKVFGKITDLDEQYPELVEEAKLILKKCNGLPLAIVTIGGFLAKQPKTPMEWKKLNEHIGAELEMNQELGIIKDVLIKSYDGLPYHLKSCFLYMSIFPEDHIISRRQLVRRWIAEGYSSKVRGKSAKEIADSYFMELIDRSMIMPVQKSIGSRNGIDSCQVHDLMREIGIAKSIEENLVFRLEEGCSSNIQGAVRHLAISSNWKGDKTEFESAMDLSRIRSLTVSGKWRPFFISNKMMFLRVLDLEGTKGLWGDDLEGIGKLIHLRYLSVRRCIGILELPDSLGKLIQLQTLDITNTLICKLPNTIIKLTKLQFIRGGASQLQGFVTLREILSEISAVCFQSCAPQLVRKKLEIDDKLNRLDWDQLGDMFRTTELANMCCSLCMNLPFYGMPDLSGFAVPRGVSKLKALHTLGVVNIVRGKSILEEIKCLTQLRKLAVNGVSKKNCQELCSALAGLSCLESLSLRSKWEPGMHGCLDGVSPPKNLQSLKLYGYLIQWPQWNGELHSLVKLKLESTDLSEVDGTMQVLGKLPNLAILLLRAAFKWQELCFTFHREAFPSLIVLDLKDLGRFESVVFEQGAAPKLELLCHDPHYRKAVPFSGLSSLPSLKEVRFCHYPKDLVEEVQAQLGRNKNKPVMKIGRY